MDTLLSDRKNKKNSSLHVYAGAAYLKKGMTRTHQVSWLFRQVSKLGDFFADKSLDLAVQAVGDASYPLFITACVQFACACMQIVTLISRHCLLSGSSPLHSVMVA